MLKTPMLVAIPLDKPNLPNLQQFFQAPKLAQRSQILPGVLGLSMRTVLLGYPHAYSRVKSKEVILILLERIGVSHL